MRANYVLGLIGSLVTLALLFELLRRRRLREKYAVFWAVVALLTLVVAVFPSTLTAAAKVVGVEVPANLLFFVASMLLLSYAARSLPIGTAYGVWVGIGAAGAAGLGMVVLGEPATAARIFFVCLLLVAGVGLKAATGH
mgnify:CR=1 FL=1